MNSIRFRMIFFFTVMTTLTLGIFGIYSRSQLSSSLEARFQAQGDAVVNRLKVSAEQPLWNVDQKSVCAALAGEMFQTEVHSIQVFEPRGGPFCEVSRDAQGLVVRGTAVDPPNSRTLKATVYQSGMAGLQNPLDPASVVVGTLRVTLSRAHIDSALAADARRTMVEILVLDLFLIIGLSLSLNLVFRPLRRLRNALFDLAKQEGEEVRELGSQGRTEFAEVVQGFNLTLQRLKLLVQGHAEAEQQALFAVQRAEQANEELQATQKSLLQAEKLASLGGLVAGVAHEINTPVGITLTSASGLLAATEAIRGSIADGSIRKSNLSVYVETAHSYCTIMLRNTERAAQLIQSFKLVAADQTSEQRRTYDLEQYIGEVVSSLRPVLSRSQVRVEVECLGTISLDGYPGAMAQVLTNLAMNSVTHAFRDVAAPTIVLRASSGPEGVQLVFSDNGCGISEADLKRIFDPFFTTRRGQGGTGLGLNIVHNIMAKQFAGTIAVASVLGSGTQFTLTFPNISPNAVTE